MTLVGFQPAILSRERQRTYALDRAAIRVGHYDLSPISIKSYFILIPITFYVLVTYKLHILDVFIREPRCQSEQLNKLNTINQLFKKYIPEDNVRNTIRANTNIIINAYRVANMLSGSSLVCPWNYRHRLGKMV
jgi:hypothetical protein